MSFQSHILPLLSHFLARRSCANWTWQPRRHVQQTRIVTRLSCLAHNNIKPTLVPSLCQAGAPKGRAQAALKVHLGGAMSSASHWQQWLEYLPRKICEDVPLQRPGWCSVRQRGEHRVKCQRDLQHSNVRTHTHVYTYVHTHIHTVEIPLILSENMHTFQNPTEMWLDIMFVAISTRRTSFWKPPENTHWL